jgi:TetR/AcrR family transcriptional regulator, regulator of autoinduction and epiphytic fitness
MSRSVMKKPYVKRRYNSSRRKEQALQTRRQIVEAARQLFLRRGYTGATIDAIAQEAGVAVETVYATFGSKRAILSRLIDVSLVGDEKPMPLLQREGPQAVMNETDQHRQVRLFVEDIYEIMSRMTPIFEIMRAAAKTDPEIAGMYENILNHRVQGLMAFIRALMKNRPLRDGITAEEASETVWTLTSADVITLLITNRGWSAEQYKRWLTDVLTRVLLP